MKNLFRNMDAIDFIFPACMFILLLIFARSEAGYNIFKPAKYTIYQLEENANCDHEWIYVGRYNEIRMICTKCQTDVSVKEYKRYKEYINKED